MVVYPSQRAPWAREKGRVGEEGEQGQVTHSFSRLHPPLANNPPHHHGRLQGRRLHPAHPQDDEEPAAGPPPDGERGGADVVELVRGLREREQAAGPGSIAGCRPARPAAGGAVPFRPPASSGARGTSPTASPCAYGAGWMPVGAPGEARSRALRFCRRRRRRSLTSSLSPLPSLRSWTSCTRAALTCPSPRSRRSCRRCVGCCARRRRARERASREGTRRLPAAALCSLVSHAPSLLPSLPGLRCEGHPADLCVRLPHGGEWRREGEERKRGGRHLRERNTTEGIDGRFPERASTHPLWWSPVHDRGPHGPGRPAGDLAAPPGCLGARAQ